MSIAALMGLVNVTGTLVLDSQGKLVLLPQGVDPRPGDVVLEQVAEQPSNELEGIKLAQVDVSSDDFGSSLLQGDQDALDIIAQIESGEDPTQNEDQATAAGDGLSSSISDAATVEAINPQVQAATFFETTGLDPRSLNDTQTNTLLDIFSNAAPVTVFDLRNYDEEAQDGELNLDFPIDPNGDVLTLTVTELPKLGTLTLADGTPVTLGQQLTQAEFEGLQFDAPMEYTAGEDAGQFTYTVDDGRGEINSVQSGGVAITINPINDIPVIVEPGEGSVTESGHFDNGDIDAGNDTATGQVVATDNDTDSVLAYSVANQSDQYGSISIDSKTGEWTYTLNNTSTATQALAEGQTATSEFTVLVTDDKGAVVTDTIVITINGTNDKPEFSTSSNFSGQVIEAGNLDDGTEVAGQSIVSGTLAASDVDQGSSLTFTVEDGSSDFGSLQVQPSGLWVFNLDNNSPQTQALKEGQTQEIQFTVSVTDDKGAVTSEVVTITITGTNDQPTFNASSKLVGAVTEAGHDDDGNVISGTPTATGTLTADDVDADAQLKFAVDNGDSPYGKLVVQEGGQWTFTLDNTTTETQALKEGETKDVSFMVKVTDEFGAVNTETVTITITGTNDVPTIDGNSVTAGAVKEAGHEDDGTVVSGTPSATGTIEATDVDADSVLAFSAEGSSNYGSFAIDPVTGKWTFTLDNNSDATQGLKEGQSEDVIFTVKVTDDKGAVTEQAVTITITGTNDQPTFNASSKLVGTVTEAGHDDAGNPQAGTSTATGTLVADDVDAGATHKFSVDNGDSPYGKLVVQEGGQWTFTLDNTTTETQALKEGETKDVRFMVKVTDEFGAVSTETVTITITGTNDVPTIDGNSVTAGAVKEAGHEDDGTVVSGTPSATGTIEATDVDADSVLAFSAEGSSNYGSFAIDPATGKWTFTLDNNSDATQGLKEGQSEDVIFTVKVTDDKGAVTEQAVTITITGTNDQPTFNASSKLVGTVTEAGHDDAGNPQAGTSTATGTLVADDVDAGATHKFSVDNGDSPYGKLVVQEGGQWTFTLDNTTTETQALKEGETKDVSFTVKVTDEFGAVNTETVTITITGTNDAATIDGNSVTAGAVKEAGHEDDGTVVSGTPSATGTIEATDVDADSVLAFSAEGSSNYGSFAIDPATGKWTFTLDNNSDATQGLKEGQSEDVIFTVKVTDDKGAVTEQAVTITITGTNDQPTFNASSKLVGAVTEAGHDDAGNPQAGTSTATGTLVADDVDAGATHKFSVDNGDSPYGKLVVQEGGQWTFTLDNTTTETQALKEGETKDVSFMVKVTDEFGAVNTETVTITITGTNDAATIEGNSVTAGAVKEAGHEDDGTVVSGTPSATGTIEATDVDADSVLAFSAEGSSHYGSFAIDPATGKWTFTLDNNSDATQGLKEGQSEDVIFTVKVTDDKGAVTEQAVTITITGTNDQPTFNASSKLVGAVTEVGHDDDGNVISGTPTATGTLIADDVDADAQLKFAVDNGDSPYGKLVVQEGGQWTFTLDNTTTETQALKEGETKDVSFTVKVTDEFGAVNTETVTITITGTNDAATIEGNSVTAGAVKEAGHEDDGTVVSGTPSATGTIEATDVDADSVLAFSAEGSSNYGSFVIDPVTGKWTFTLDNNSDATQGLKEGQSEDVIFTVKVTDDKGAVTEQAVTITITGTNDQPTFNASSKLVGAVTEAGHDDDGNVISGTPTATGTLIADDVDADAQLKFAVDNGDSPYGKLVVQEGGQWTFTLDNTTTETQALKEGETKDVSFTVKVTDEFGAVSTETVTITITGTNDQPTFTSSTTLAATVTEAGHTDSGATVPGTDVATGTLVGTDVDADSTLTYYIENGNSDYGNMVVLPDGRWTFTLNNDSEQTQALKEGQTKDVNFTVTVRDEHGAINTEVVTISIKGTNDKPTFVDSSELSGNVVESGHLDNGTAVPGTPSASGQLHAEDIDADAKLTFSVENGATGYGNLVVQPNGQWTFALDNNSSLTQALRENETKELSFTVKVTDEFGATDTEVVKITITGTNDKPTITQSSDLSGDVKESGHQDDGTPVTGTAEVEGTLIGADVDAGSSLTFSIDDGSSDYGTLVVDDDGDWKFTLDNTSSQVQSLKEGQSHDVTFTVKVRDELGAINTETVTITVNGTNDQPTFTSSSVLNGAVTEAGHLDDGTVVAGVAVAAGTLTATDVDADAQLKFSVDNGSNDYGELVVQENGQWKFTLDNNSVHTQALRENETKELSFTVKVTDEFGAVNTEVVKINITGTNDQPQITSASNLTGTVIEAGNNDDGTIVSGVTQATGTLVGSDADAGSNLTYYVNDGSSDFGNLVVLPDGQWTFTLDNNSPETQALKEGQTQDIHFTVTVRDELGALNTEVITISVKGTNDQPTFTNASDLSGSVVEAGNLDDGTFVAGTRIATGTLHGTDIDADAQLTFSVDNGSTPYGNLVVQPNGEWRFTLNNRSSATQALREGETRELSFNVKVTDEFGAVSTEVVTIDITGTNDAPNIKITGNQNLVEDGVESRSGNLRDQDPDANDDHTWEITDSNGGVGEYGTLTIFENANGVTKWRYDLEASTAQSGKVQALAHGEVVTETFTIKVTDEFGAVNEKTITLNITGTNDQPVINGDFVGSVTEDDFPNNDPSQPIKFVGQLDPGDVDTNDTHSWSLNTGKGQFGTISIDPVTGEWTYTLNNSNPSVQALRPGDTPLTETFTVTVKDSSGQSNGSDTQTITINISGTNDAPELAGTTTGSVIEDTPGREVATGNLAVSDIDSTDSHSWQVQGENPVNGKATGTYGQLSVDDNGKWTYELDSDSLATRSIPPGMTVTDTFQVVVTDAGGLTDTITVTVSVAGTNSEPEIVVKPEYTVIEDGAALSGTIIAGIPTQDQLDNNVIGGGDPDQGEIVSWSVLQSGQYGTFSIDEATGTWTYVLNNNHPVVDSLDKGDILPGGDTVQVRVRDKYGVESIQEIKIVIEGENDAPNITGAQNKVIFEDAIEAGQYTTSGQLSSGDVDADDVHQWEISDSNNGRGEYGTLTMDSNGKWTFTYDQQSKLSEIRALKPGQIVTDEFEVKVTDSQGATSVETVTIQIEGQNDAPVVTGDVSATYVEDNGTDDTSDDSTPIEGQLVLTDYDNDDKAEVVISSGQSHNVYNGLSGELSIDKDGKWSFVPKNDVLQSLAEGETETEVFTILVTDRNGATVTQDITITIEGRNDVPVISGESTGTVVEDGTAAQFGVDLTRTDGQLSAVDVDNNSSIVSWSIESSGASGSAPSGLGTYGTLTLGNDGKWTYVLDNSLPATQALIAGETVQEKFYVVATDNDGGVSNRQEIVIDVIGQQDPGDGSGSGGIIPVDVSELEVTEDQQLVDRDSFIFPIPPGANFIPVNGGVYGQLVRTATGGWKYELDNDSVLVQGLDEGETATESWRIVVGPFYIDVNVTINGSADKPEITYNTDITKPQDDTVLLGEAHEDVTDSISGVLGVDDADLGDSHVWAVEDIQGEYGTLTIDPDTGKWTYVLDPSKELPAEKEVFDTFYVTVTDTEAGEGASTKSDRREVQVKVIGSAENFENPNPNDEKYIVKTITANEDNSDSNETGTGPSEIVISSDNAGGPLVLDPNIELGSQITWTLVDGNGTYGSIVVNDDGSWVFTLDNDSRAVQSLQEGETKHDVFEVYAVDQYGKTIVDDNGLPQTLEIVIDVNGQNDAPTLKANVEETIVADDVDQTISGKLAVTDIDTQDQGHHTWVATPNNVDNAYGTLVFNADGTWSYKVDPNNPDIIALGANETIEQTWTVVVTDPKGATATQTLTINIQGENQAPTMTTVDGAVTEDVIDSGGTTVSVTKAIVLDDLDTNDTVTLDPTNLDGTYGHLPLTHLQIHGNTFYSTTSLMFNH
ncbi:VCBS domain-containing protein [Vibrio barjaei]|uniref:VCBS domain-containing protein n=1 Tax=Vibrio barjaei TaxID=1676683 RepID=A0ABW7IN67_9VIBR